MMRTLVQGERWDEILDGKTLPVYDKPREQAWRHWAVSQAYAAKGNLDAARAESKLMDASLREYKEKVKMPVPDVLEIARVELDGHLKMAEGKERGGSEEVFGSGEPRGAVGLYGAAVLSASGVGSAGRGSDEERQDR